MSTDVLVFLSYLCGGADGETILWNMSGYLDPANLAITVTTSDTAAPAGKTKEGLTHLIHVHLTFPQSITVSKFSSHNRQDGQNPHNIL